MANRHDYFFRQKVTEAELDSGFDKLEDADRDIMSDQLLSGVMSNGVVSEAAAPDLTVDVSGPHITYDQQGRRIFHSSLQNVDATLDEVGASTAVAGGGNEKILALFVEFDRLLSDPRTDGNGATVFFVRDESFKFNIVQSAEAPIGTAVPPPLRGDQILLADITLINAQTQILNADIDTARREDVFKLTGSPTAITAGRVKDVLQDMLDLINAAAAGGSDISEGGDLIVDFTTLQTAVQDLAEQSHVGIDRVFGVPDIFSSPPGVWNYNATERGLAAAGIGDFAFGWWAMEGGQKVIEIDVFVKDVDAITRVEARLRTFDMAANTLTAILDTQVSDGSGDQTLSFSAGLPFVLGPTEIIFIELQNKVGDGGGVRALRGGRVKARRLS